ncbi:hypothetical protein BgiBS90_033644 [Biomphalaria glabrata]|nr:hypothetical protein BgiBS90_033644 [Biomphalaria glabrata]
MSNVTHHEVHSETPLFTGERGNSSPTNANSTGDSNILFISVIALSVLVTLLIVIIIYLQRKKIKRVCLPTIPDNVDQTSRMEEVTEDQSHQEFTPLSSEDVITRNETLRLDIETESIASDSINVTDLYKLFDLLIDVLEPAGCVKLFLNLDPDGDFKDVLSQRNYKTCFQFFVDWTSKHSNANHGDILKRSLAHIGYKLPPDDEFYDVSSENQDDGVIISKLLVSLAKSRLLKYEFGQFCLRLAGRLSVTQIWQVTEEMKLTTAMRLKAQFGSIDAAFAQTLTEWGLRSPGSSSGGSEWDKLMLLKSSLQESCGKEAEVVFEECAADIVDFLKRYSLDEGQNN